MSFYQTTRRYIPEAGFLDKSPTYETRNTLTSAFHVGVKRSLEVQHSVSENWTESSA